MGIFDKYTECPNCRNVVLKKVMLTVDAKKQGKKRICRDCAIGKFYEAMLEFNEPMALVGL